MNDNRGYDRDKEIREALEAGDVALQYLNEAWDHLNKARGWGIVDMLGGDLFSTFMKHNQVNQAGTVLSNARVALQRYSSELADIREAVQLDVQVDGLLKFADFFLDGLIIDWMVQSKIKRTREQVSEAIERVEEMQHRLRGMLIRLT